MRAVQRRLSGYGGRRFMDVENRQRLLEYIAGFHRLANFADRNVGQILKVGKIPDGKERLEPGSHALLPALSDDFRSDPGGVPAGDGLWLGVPINH